MGISPITTFFPDPAMKVRSEMEPPPLAKAESASGYQDETYTPSDGQASEEDGEHRGGAEQPETKTASAPSEPTIVRAEAPPDDAETSGLSLFA